MACCLALAVLTSVWFYSVFSRGLCLVAFGRLFGLINWSTRAGPLLAALAVEEVTEEWYYFILSVPTGLPFSGN